MAVGERLGERLGGSPAARPRRVGPKQAMPASASASARPAATARLRPDHHQVGGDLAGQGDLAGDVGGRHGAGLGRASPCPDCPARRPAGSTSGERGDLPGQGVLAPARADEEDVHAPALWRARGARRQALAAHPVAGLPAASDRQIDGEGGPAPSRALHRQAAAMAVDDVLDDGQAEARAGRSPPSGPPPDRTARSAAAGARGRCPARRRRRAGRRSAGPAAWSGVSSERCAAPADARAIAASAETLGQHLDRHRRAAGVYLSAFSARFWITCRIWSRSAGDQRLRPAAAGAART